jgi:hypothetical protein
MGGPLACKSALLKFFPYDWHCSDNVEVNFDGLWQLVCDPVLKEDPRQVIDVQLTSLQTGSVIHIASVHNISLGIAIIAISETESRRNRRWRIKQKLAVEVPKPLSFLTTGRR